MSNLYRRGKIWYARFERGGLEIRKALDTDRREAEIKLRRMLEDRDASKYRRPMRGMTWAEFEQKYLAYSKAEKAHLTHLRDIAAISAMKACFVPHRPTDLTTESLERFKHFRKAKGKGIATINRDMNALKAMMRKAADWGIIGRDEIPAPKGYKETRGRLLFYSVKELQKILGACRGAWKTMCLLGGRAGLRRSEMYWLAWEDVNFETGILSVTPKDGWNPKDYEQRHVPMASDLAIHLKGLKREGRWVLGDRYSLGVMTTFFRRIVRRVGLRGGLHTLRHTFASHLAQAGVPLYTIAKLLGHSSVETTAIYAHLSPKSFRDAIERLPGMKPSQESARARRR